MVIMEMGHVTGVRNNSPASKDRFSSATPFTRIEFELLTPPSDSPVPLPYEDGSERIRQAVHHRPATPATRLDAARSAVASVEVQDRRVGRQQDIGIESRRPGLTSSPVTVSRVSGLPLSEATAWPTVLAANKVGMSRVSTLDTDPRRNQWVITQSPGHGERFLPLSRSRWSAITSSSENGVRPDLTSDSRLGKLMPDLTRKRRRFYGSLIPPPALNLQRMSMATYGLYQLPKAMGAGQWCRRTMCIHRFPLFMGMISDLAVL